MKQDSRRGFDNAFNGTNVEYNCAYIVSYLQMSKVRGGVFTQFDASSNKEQQGRLAVFVCQLDLQLNR